MPLLSPAMQSKSTARGKVITQLISWDGSDTDGVVFDFTAQGNAMLLREPVCVFVDNTRGTGQIVLSVEGYAYQLVIQPGMIASLPLFSVSLPRVTVKAADGASGLTSIVFCDFMLPNFAFEATGVSQTTTDTILQEVVSGGAGSESLRVTDAGAISALGSILAQLKTTLAVADADVLAQLKTTLAVADADVLAQLKTTLAVADADVLAAIDKGNLITSVIMFNFDNINSEITGISPGDLISKITIFDNSTSGTTKFIGVYDPKSSDNVLSTETIGAVVTQNSVGYLNFNKPYKVVNGINIGQVLNLEVTSGSPNYGAPNWGGAINACVLIEKLTVEN